MTKFERAILEDKAHEKIMIDKIYLGMCNGDWNAGIILTRLIYWYKPDKNMRTKIRIKDKDGEWICKSINEWREETLLSERKVKEGLKHLLELNIIRKKIKKFNAIPTLHFQINQEIFLQKYEEYLEKINNENNQKEDENQDEEIDSDQTDLNETHFSNRTKRPNRIEQNVLTNNNILLTIDYKQDNNNSSEEKSLEVKSEELVQALSNANLPSKKPNLIYLIYTKYIDNWKKRYKSLKEPKLTNKLAGQIKLVLRDFSNIDELEKMLRAFIACDEGYLIAKAHDFGLFLLDLNKWLALSEHPELAYQFTTEYAKQRKYLDKKQIVEKEEKQIREREIRQQIELEEQEKERLRKEREEKEKQRLEEEKKKAEAERLVQEQKAKELLKDFEDSGIMNKLKKKGQ